MLAQKHQPHPAPKRLYTLLRIWTVLFAALCTVFAVLWSDLIVEWNLNNFWVMLALVVHTFGTVCLSLFTLFWELTRYLGRRSGGDLHDTAVAKVLHYVLIGVASAGIATVVFLILVWTELLSDEFAVIHYSVGMLLAAVYAALGVHAVIRRMVDCRQAEREWLAEEKEAWEGYLT